MTDHGHMAQRRLQAGFTLVEVLVVISIIAVTVSILLPSLARSRDLAMALVCANNQKQIGMAIHEYATDADGAMPYGPKAEPTSIADFYVVDGMVTTQISLLDGGKPVGTGLLLGSYLSHQPEVLFCPDSDQSFDVSKELDRFGRTQALSTYFYRHGSNTLESFARPPHTWSEHIQLQDLGNNYYGQPIRALLMDQNFVVHLAVPAFNIVTRTNHDRYRANTLYADGHVSRLDNGDDRYTAQLGSALHMGPTKILSVLELADTPR